MKKIIALLLSFCMVFALVACGGPSNPGSETPDPAGTPTQDQPTVSDPVAAKYLTQIVKLNVFGMDVEVTFVQDAAGTQFSFSYTFAGNDIEGSGEIVDGVYTLTNDPSGFASEMEEALYPALTSTWTGDNGETITQEPFAAPVKEDTSAATYQIVVVEMFGDKVPVTMTLAPNGTDFTMEYEVMGEAIVAYGNVSGGEYTVTDDPSGYGVMMIENVVPLLTDVWTPVGEEVPVQGGDEPVVAPTGEYAKYQVVTVEMFGDKIDVTVSVDADMTVFGIAYSAMGNDITASGTIANGEYTITDDPSGYAVMMITNVVPLITDEWIVIGTESAPAGEYAKYQVVTVEMFGDKIDVTVSVDAGETVFGIAYSAMGNDITASGTIADGVYTITDDPSGYAGMMMQNVAPLITGEWTNY